MKVTTLKDAQKAVKTFTTDNNWKDFPNIDKFDHLHEELIEMSKHLRYKSTDEQIEFIKQNKDIFEDGIGDLLFALCRLSNQLGVDLEESFNLVHTRIVKKYKGKVSESK